LAGFLFLELGQACLRQAEETENRVNKVYAGFAFAVWGGWVKRVKRANPGITSEK